MNKDNYYYIHIIHHFPLVGECRMEHCDDYKDDNQAAKRAGCYKYAKEIFSYEDQLVRDYPSFSHVRYVINKNGRYRNFPPYYLNRFIMYLVFLYLFYNIIHNRHGRVWV